MEMDAATLARLKLDGLAMQLTLQSVLQYVVTQNWLGLKCATMGQSQTLLTVRVTALVQSQATFALEGILTTHQFVKKFVEMGSSQSEKAVKMEMLHQSVQMDVQMAVRLSLVGLAVGPRIRIVLEFAEMEN